MSMISKSVISILFQYFYILLERTVEVRKKWKVCDVVMSCQFSDMKDDS